INDAKPGVTHHPDERIKFLATPPLGRVGDFLVFLYREARHLFHLALDALPSGCGIPGNHARIVKEPEKRLYPLLVGSQRVDCPEILAPIPIGEMNECDAVEREEPILLGEIPDAVASLL